MSKNADKSGGDLRARRRAEVRRLLRAGSASTQRELVDALHDAGLPATQATVSRDLREMGAVRITEPDNGPRWRLPDNAPEDDAGLLRRLVRRVEWASNLVVIHTRVGGAQAAASALDEESLAGVLGTVAGDDTVLVVTRDSRRAGAVGRRLRRDVAERTP